MHTILLQGSWCGSWRNTNAFLLSISLDLSVHQHFSIANCTMYTLERIDFALTLFLSLAMPVRVYVSVCDFSAILQWHMKLGLVRIANLNTDKHTQ